MLTLGRAQKGRRLRRLAFYGAVLAGLALGGESSSTVGSATPLGVVPGNSSDVAPVYIASPNYPGEDVGHGR